MKAAELLNIAKDSGFYVDGNDITSPFRDCVPINKLLEDFAEKIENKYVRFTTFYQCVFCLHLYEDKPTSCDCLPNGEKQEYNEIETYIKVRK